MSQDLLQQGIAWLAGELKQNASETVTYARGATTFPVQATLGTTLLRLDDGAGGTRVQYTDRDFIVAAADLAAGGIVGEPLQGDQATVTVGAITYQYEVASYNGEPAWRWSDPFRTLLRIHAKLLSQW